MALTNEDMDQLINAMSGEGFRFSMASANESEVSDIILAKGELINLVDKKMVKLGDGVSPIKDLPYLTYANNTVYKGDSLAVMAEKIWNQAILNTGFGEIKTLGIPQNLIDEFINLKPSEFSLMLGEDLSSSSPMSDYFEKAPNAKGAFFRNYHYGDTTRDPDAGNRQMLSFQNDAQQYWEFWNKPRHKEHVMAGCVEQSKDANKSSSPIHNNSSSPQWRVSNSLQSGVRTASENRSRNILTISIWRIA